jgi:hypothetical protein
MTGHELRVFDLADPVTGPGFAPDHPVIDDPAERGQLLAYLYGGHPVLTTTATLDDIVDPQSGAEVPTSFRTDGGWIWTDSVQYYLDHYGLAPDAELTTHIRAQIDRGQLLPDTDQETVIQAADFLLNPPSPEAPEEIWFPGNALPAACRPDPLLSPTELALQVGGVCADLVRGKGPGAEWRGRTGREHVPLASPMSDAAWTASARAPGLKAAASTGEACAPPGKPGRLMPWRMTIGTTWPRTRR